MESLRMWTKIPAAPERVYTAWMSADEHTAFTGGAATMDPVVGGRFTAWDGYISGKNLELEPYHRIVQAWRTTEFPEGSADSWLEILLQPVEGGTRLTLIQNHVPAGQSATYKQGWRDYYFSPMKTYFKRNG